MKKLKKPFDEYWHSKKTRKPDLITPEATIESEDDEPYTQFKKMLQHEANRRWNAEVQSEKER
ncbi:hypothetical protein [Halalkalibacter krulwichiae]|uniref:Uncharacterized protein n=1 Tax=Halalkalibacter krulwichiae TaxID=199441 RepID=A0A1X9MDJ7_9BACI|nr:hypothetical protein [Halalkalibacter krulwichiae]ARK31519.1 hypothetical protein BkAM31D_17670 [Halalkalibacter krulwichiae]